MSTQNRTATRVFAIIQRVSASVRALAAIMPVRWLRLCQTAPESEDVDNKSCPKVPTPKETNAHETELDFLYAYAQHGCMRYGRKQCCTSAVHLCTLHSRRGVLELRGRDALRERTRGTIRILRQTRSKQVEVADVLVTENAGCPTAHRMRDISRPSPRDSQERPGLES